MKSTLLAWLPLAIAITVICGTISISVQQVLRQGANDPQIQYVEEMTHELSAGQPPLTILPSQRADMQQTLEPFAMVLDGAGAPLSYTGTLDSAAPKISAGVLEYVKAHGQDRITWQPQKGVRIAAVIDKYEYASTTGFVLVGRSLREVEKREHNLMVEVASGWLAALVLSFGAMLLTNRKKPLA